MHNTDYLMHGIGVLDSGDSYEEVSIYILKKNEDGSYNAGTYRNGTKNWSSVNVEDLQGPIFPSIMGLVIKGIDLSIFEKEVTLYNKVEGLLERILQKKDAQSILIIDAITLIHEETTISKSSIQVIIKVLLAEKLSYKYKKLKTGEYITFTEDKKDSVNSKEYYGTFAQELELKSKQIGLLISHGQTAGNYRELILRNLLRKYLPKKFSIATGFIEGIPRQFDIIIFDSFNFPPVFSEGELVVARRDSIRAIIEVKTNLDSTKLDESLELFHDISFPGKFRPRLPIFKGVYSFRTEYKTPNSMAKRIKDFYSKPYYNEELGTDIERGINYLYREITAVCTMNEMFLYSKYMHHDGDDNKNIVPALISIHDEEGVDIHTAMFFATLLRYLDVDYYAKKSTIKSFTDLLMSNTVNVTQEEYLMPESWFPNTSSQSEHDFTQSSIIERLNKLNEWFAGNKSSSDYLRELEIEHIKNISEKECFISR